MLKPIVLLGGSFDPVHDGHLALAEAVLAATDPERFLFVPAWQNPLKKSTGASASERLAMLKLAVNEVNDPRIQILDWEIQNPKPSYTIDTLERVKKEYGKNLIFVAGTEVFSRILEWREPVDVLTSCDWILVVREGEKTPDLQSVFTPLGIADLTEDSSSPQRWTYDDGRHSLQLLEMKPLPYSSTALRTQIAHALRSGASSPMPPGLRRSVWQFIKENRLYAVSERGV